MPWNTKVLNQNLNLFPETPRFVAIQKWCLPESYVKSYVKSYILLPPIFFKSPPKKIRQKNLLHIISNLQPFTPETPNCHRPGFTCDMWSASVIGKTYLCGTKSSWLLDNTRCLKGALAWKFAGRKQRLVGTQKLGGVFKAHRSFVRPKDETSDPGYFPKIWRWTLKKFATWRERFGEPRNWKPAFAGVHVGSLFRGYEVQKIFRVFFHPSFR